MVKVTVSIGSNIDRENNIRSCVRRLRHQFGQLCVSTLYETPAVGFDGEPFYNMVATFNTDLPIERLVECLRQVELEHGRERSSQRYSSRTLDVDLLLYADVVRHDKQISIPRNEIVQYGFVLGPLAEIAGEEKHPELGIKYRDLWRKFDQSSAQLVPIPIAF